MIDHNSAWFEKESTLLDYQHNKLSPEEVIAFEEYIMDKPEILDRLELNQTFATYSAETSFAKSKSFWAHFNISNLLIGGLSGAAVFTFMLLFLPLSTSENMTSASHIIYMDVLRSTAQPITQINLPAQSNSNLILVVSVGPEVTGPLSAIIQDSNKQEIYELNDIVVGNTGEVILQVDSTKLEQSPFSLYVNGSTLEETLMFNFDIVRESK